MFISCFIVLKVSSLNVFCIVILIPAVLLDLFIPNKGKIKAILAAVYRTTLLKH